MTFEDVLDLPLIHAGKVRELYALPDDRLLMVATDNISAFDYVLTTPIPDKGAILTQLSLWWFDQLSDAIENHVLSAEVPAAVDGRALVCERLDMIGIECVARGYLTGSGWLEYQQSGTVCGIPLPAGLLNGSRLPEPIFTPATKAPMGEHDENITFEQVVEAIGAETANEIRDLTLAIYRRAEGIARARGIILADTKFEFGRRPDGKIIVADEVLTPDSSRFWEASQWQPGEKLEPYDKQYVRDWLLNESGWDRAGDQPPPGLPDEVIAATRDRYVEAYVRLTGDPFQAGSRPETATIHPMTRVVVDVMPKPEILDPQGKAVTGALNRLGFAGIAVRQGKRFELDVEGEVTEERMADIHRAAETLLANTVIESFVVRVEDPVEAS